MKKLLVSLVSVIFVSCSSVDTPPILMGAKSSESTFGPMLVDNSNYFLFHPAKVIEVYDGDTITVLFDLGYDIKWEAKIRLFGVNAPEVTGVEKPNGILVRDYVRSKILGEEVTILSPKDYRDKYGRVLGVVFKNGINLNAELIEANMVKRYL